MGILEYLILGWVACGLLAYMAILAHFQRRFSIIARSERAGDLMFSAMCGVLGPLGLLAFVLMEISGGDIPFRYGLMLWPPGGSDGTP